jgi:transposase-like protein
MTQKPYTKNFKLESVQSFLRGRTSISKSATNQNIPKQTLARWIKIYSQGGEPALENKKSGITKKPINPDVEKKILQLWDEKKRSKYSMYKDLRIKGVNTSKWQIQKIYEKHNLVYRRE